MLYSHVRAEPFPQPAWFCQVRETRSGLGNAVLAAVALTAASLTPWVATAGPLTPYFVQHTFTLRPGGNVVPQVTEFDFQHTWIQSDALPGVFQFNLGGQPAAANPFGMEFQMATGQVAQRPTTLLMNRNANAIGGGGTGGLITSTADVMLGASEAQANSRYSVNPFAAGTPVTGTIRADGFADARIPPSPTTAYAFSATTVEATGGRQLRNGNIVWGPTFRSNVAGRASFSQFWDPIGFDVIDLNTGTETQGLLLQILSSLTGPGSIEWDNGLFSLTATDADFSIDLTSPFIPANERGSVDIEISGGVVTRSNSSGIFTGFGPPVGSPGSFTHAVSDFVFDYDLGDFKGDPLSVGLDFGGAGAALDVAVPEPCKLDGSTAGPAWLGAGGRLSVANGRVAEILRRDPSRDSREILDDPDDRFPALSH